jgi:hypothetical protein
MTSTVSNGKQKPRRLSLIHLPFAHYTNGSFIGPTSQDFLYHHPKPWSCDTYHDAVVVCLFIYK